ncbi:hypothetical protein [Neptuniibacter sp. QD37_11]|uniref:hypothetical protein n=1 Tax=Neptuniibacter sp. QD37_11 TaxID=3398209 RepID=UPI0039F6311C
MIIETSAERLIRRPFTRRMLQEWYDLTAIYERKLQKYNQLAAIFLASFTITSLSLPFILKAAIVGIPYGTISLYTLIYILLGTVAFLGYCPKPHIDPSIDRLRIVVDGVVYLNKPKTSLLRWVEPPPYELKKGTLAKQVYTMITDEGRPLTQFEYNLIYNLHKTQAKEIIIPELPGLHV